MKDDLSENDYYEYMMRYHCPINAIEIINDSTNPKSNYYYIPLGEIFQIGFTKSNNSLPLTQF